MLIPTPHETLRRNVLVIGARIVKLLKRRSFLIEDIFHALGFENGDKDASLFFDALTFLYIVGLITVDGFRIRLVTHG